MLLHLRDQRSRRAIRLGHLDGEGAVDRGQRVGEDGVDDDALDLDDPAGVRGRFSVVGHDSPGSEGQGARSANRARSLAKRLSGLALTQRGSGYPGRACGGVGHGWSSVASSSRRPSPSSPPGAGSAGTTARCRRRSTRPRSSTRVTAWSSRSQGCRRRRHWTSSSSGWTRRRTRSTTSPVISTTRPPERSRGSARAARRPARAARRRHPGNRRPGARPRLRRHPQGAQGLNFESWDEINAILAELRDRASR